MKLRLQTREAIGDDLEASSISVALAVTLQEKHALLKSEKLSPSDPLPNGTLQDENFASNHLLTGLFEKHILSVLQIQNNQRSVSLSADTLRKSEWPTLLFRTLRNTFVLPI